ncbi:MAG: DUF4129 domain-containing protein [Micrococcales bacterium]|nr:DUF4129 domain-containing protein [Micrococcales bacterium]
MSVWARVAPDNPTARTWLEDELGKVAYQERTDPLRRLLEALQRWWDGLVRGSAPGDSAPSPIVLGIVVALLLALGLWALRFVRRDHAVDREPGAVLGGQARTAAEHRALAEEALRAGDHATAVIEGMRAIAQSAADRALLDDAPSATAHEIALSLGTGFPAHAGALRHAADLFDSAAYGGGQPGVDGARHVLDLGERLDRERPAASALATAGAGSAMPAVDDPDDLFSVANRGGAQ